VKIGNIEISKEQMTVVGVAALMVAGAYLVLFRPVMHSLAVKSRAYNMVRSQMRDARAVIEATGRIGEERELLTERQVPVAIDELTKHGKAMKVSFQSIRPRELIQDQNPRFKVLPVDLSIEATDKQMVAFMGSLDDLNKNLITVTGFDVVPDKDDPSQLKMALTVNLYFLSGDAAQGK